MAVKIITPDNEAHWLEMRKTVLTSTEVPALFNLSPYMTYAELWYRKKGLLDVPFEATERMRWGNRLESAIAHGIAEDLGLKIRPMKEFYLDMETRLGASFDFEVEPDGLLEIKNLDALQFRDKWEVSEDGEIEAPPHIEIQTQHQLLMSGRSHSRIGALVGGNEVKVLPRAPDMEIIDAIRAEAGKFWASIDNDQPPAPDYAKDSSLYCKLHGYAQPGTVLMWQDNAAFREIAFNHGAVTAEIKRLEGQKDAYKAEMLSMIGEAESVKCGDFSVTAGMVGPAHMNYVRDGYRQFRINWPRKKK